MKNLSIATTTRLFLFAAVCALSVQAAEQQENLMLRGGGNAGSGSGSTLAAATTESGPTTRRRVQKYFVLAQGGGGPPEGVPGGPPQFVIDRFRDQYFLKADFNPPGRVISADNFIQVGDETVSVADQDLEEETVFSPGATYSVDGSEQGGSPPSIHLYRSKYDRSVLIEKDNSGGIKSVTKTNPGRVISLERSEPGSPVYVEITSDDFDDSRSRGDTADAPDEVPDDDRRFLEKLGDKLGVVSLQQQQEEGQPTTQRELETTCSEYYVVDVAIAYDSYWCTDLGGASETTAQVQRIVASASQYYEVFCRQLRISHIDARCSSSNDPYKSMVDDSTEACGPSFNSGELLDDFTFFWDDNRNGVDRAAAHLFYGREVGGSIGCAWGHTVCNRWGYGVNEMSYNSNTVVQGKIFAHELGHNAGAPHVSGTIMQGRIGGCGSCTSFNDATISIFEDILTDTRSCSKTPIYTVSGDVDPPSPTTSAPTKAPTDAPTKAPVTAPVATDSPTKAPVTAPVATDSPTKAPVTVNSASCQDSKFGSCEFQDCCDGLVCQIRNNRGQICVTGDATGSCAAKFSPCSRNSDCCSGLGCVVRKHTSDPVCF